MPADELNFPAILDEIRAKEGTDALKAMFNKLSKSSPSKSAALVNDKNLSFASLFILGPEIQRLNLIDRLSTRCRIALEVTNEILIGRSIFTIHRPICKYIQEVGSALKWMVVTGSHDDGFNNQYDEVLDKCSILLLKVYGDKTILPTIGDMIFNRYRKGLLIHDLTWAFFESRDPRSLIFIAERLKSNDEKDVELSQRLLHFIPGLGKDKSMDANSCYCSAIRWIEDNILFLYSTGQCFQETGTPVPYNISLEAKYLCSAVTAETGEMFREPDPDESRLIEEFRELDEDTQILLSDFSYNMHRKDINTWNEWLHSLIADQVNLARSGGL